MKIAVMGTGAIGGYYGGRLAAAGNDVTFIARGAQLEALRNNGLKVTSPLGDFTVDPAAATDDPAEVGPVDVVMFMVKNYDTEAAARQIKPLGGDATAVVSFQNGVSAPDILIAELSAEHVLGGVAQIPASVPEPGVISHNGEIAKLIFGEFDNTASVRCETFRAALEDAGVDAVVADDIKTMIWQKFVFLASMSALNCVARLPIGAVLADPDLRALYVDAMKEVVAVAATQDVNLPADVVDSALKLTMGMPYAVKSSMMQDLEAGRRLEVRHLSGTVVELAARAGLEAPVHRTIYAALKPYADGPPSA